MCLLWHHHKLLKHALTLEATIYTVELIAILQTLKYLSEEMPPYKEAIIITDCLSALSKFANIQPGCDINTIEARILYLVWDLWNKGICVCFCWIEAHMAVMDIGIVESHKVSSSTWWNFPKLGPIYPPSDLFRHCKSTLLDQRQKWYDSYTAGNTYI